MRSRATSLVVIAITVLMMVLTGPSARAETVDITGDGKLPEFDVSYVSDDVLEKISAEDETGFVDEMKAQWSHCNNVIDKVINDPSWHDQKDGFNVRMNGSCVQSFVGKIGGPDYKFDSIDLTALADAIAVGTSQYQNLDSMPGGSLFTKLHEAQVAGQTASDAAEEAGASEVGQELAGAAGAAGSVAGVSQGTINAVTNPSGPFDQAANRIKEDAGKAITQGLGYVSQGLAFSGALTSFRDAYAAAAGVGLVLLAMSSVVSLARLRRGGLPAAEVIERWAASLTLGFLGLLFTPVWVFVCTQLADGMSAGVVIWLGSSTTTITGSLIDPFNALTTANSPLGWLGAILVCLLFFVAGVMLVVTFAVQFLAAYFGSVALGVMWGLANSGSGRRRLRTAVVIVVGVIFARPILLFMVGVAMKLSAAFTASADGWSTDPMGTLFRLGLGLGAILMVCFAPTGLTRFMPVVGRGGAGRAAGVGLLGGLGGGSVAGSMLGTRMHSLAGRLRGASQRGAARVSAGSGSGGATAAGQGPMHRTGGAGRGLGPGRRLRGADLSRLGRRAVAGGLRAGGVVAAGALVAGAAAASAGRAAAYESAQFARSVEEEGRQ